MKLETTVVRFNVPTHVTVRTLGDRHLKVPLSEFPATDLAELCKEFTNGVLAEAASQLKGKPKKQ